MGEIKPASVAGTGQQEEGQILKREIGGELDAKAQELLEE